MVKEIGKNEFDGVVAEGITVVDFYANWCGPCKMLAPVLDELSEQYAGKVSFAKLNVDNAQETAIKYAVSSIPCLIIFKNGEEAGRVVGFLPKTQIQAEIDKAL